MIGNEILNNGSSTIATIIPTPTVIKTNDTTISNNTNGFINTNDEIYISNPTVSSSTNSSVSLNLASNHPTSLDMSNTNANMNHVSSFINPLNNYNNTFNTSTNPSSKPQTQSSIQTSSQTQPSTQKFPSSQPMSTLLDTSQFSSELTSTVSLKRKTPGNMIITSPVKSIMNTSPSLHSSNSANSGIVKTSLFNSTPSIAKDYQKQQVFFQNNVQYNGKIYQLDPLTSSGYIQLSDEVISVLLNDTRNEGKSFELIKSYLVYFSFSDVEASHIKNMKVGDNVSFKVKMTFIAPNNALTPESNSHSPLDMENNSITQAFDIFIKNKSNIPPDVLEMMKMMENIF